MVDFSQIELTEEEYELLLLVEEERAVLYGEVHSATFRRFEQLKILEKSRVTFTEKDGSTRSDYIVEFSENGIDFLRYYKNKLKEKKKELRKYIINTIIAISALVLSLISIIWQAYTWQSERLTISLGETIQDTRQATPPGEMLPELKE